MNTLLVFTALFAGACMADVSHVVQQYQQQQPQQPYIRILESVQNADPNSNFQWGFKTENGIVAEAQGNSENSRGSYHYTSPEGIPVDITWTAGPDGFHAEGPLVPPTPEHVARTLAYNAAHPYKEEPVFKSVN